MGGYRAHLVFKIVFEVIFVSNEMNCFNFKVSMLYGWREISKSLAFIVVIIILNKFKWVCKSTIIKVLKYKALIFNANASVCFLVMSPFSYKKRSTIEENFEVWNKVCWNLNS